MDKLSELRKQYVEEENDLVAMGIYKKIKREENLKFSEFFKDKLLAAGFNLTEHDDQGKITISPTEFGVIDFYPKANKVLIRKRNKWIHPGTSFLKILLKDE